jgi:hypothetical protein
VANSTGQASNSSKAKRVMDWFRFKSLNGSTTSANHPQAHVNDHLVPPVPIPTDFDARVKAHQPAQTSRFDQPTDGHSPPAESQPTLQVPAPLMVGVFLPSLMLRSRTVFSYHFLFCLCFFVLVESVRHSNIGIIILEDKSSLHLGSSPS